MNTANLKDMVKGWFVGGFTPTAFSTQACEVAVKPYAAGDAEAAHYHKIATEVTLILSGEVEMCGKTWGAGEIVVLEPGDITAFKALSDAVTVVVKVPGALNDKYVVEE
ncbi:hypothetical protein [Pseudomonas sp. LF245]